MEKTLHTTPPAATHWSVPMARATGLSRMTVQRIWQMHQLKPHLTETFKLSCDPHFVEKLQDLSLVLAAMLRARGFTVTTARDSGQLGCSDEDQLAVAAENGSVLLTPNRVDFERLHRRWLESG